MQGDIITHKSRTWGKRDSNSTIIIESYIASRPCHRTKAMVTCAIIASNFCHTSCYENGVDRLSVCNRLHCEKTVQDRMPVVCGDVEWQCVVNISICPFSIPIDSSQLRINVCVKCGRSKSNHSRDICRVHFVPTTTNNEVLRGL